MAVQATLVPSHGGIFDVEVDGRMVFSKFEQDRFPEHDEIIEMLTAEEQSG